MGKVKKKTNIKMCLHYKSPKKIQIYTHILPAETMNGIRI
jgi:uncharacterized protein YcgL (UPF0745 family)